MFRVLYYFKFYFISILIDLLFVFYRKNSKIPAISTKQLFTVISCFDLLSTCSDASVSLKEVEPLGPKKLLMMPVTCLPKYQPINFSINTLIFQHLKQKVRQPENQKQNTLMPLIQHMWGEVAEGGEQKQIAIKVNTSRMLTLLDIITVAVALAAVAVVVA